MHVKADEFFMLFCRNFADFIIFFNLSRTPNTTTFRLNLRIVKFINISTKYLSYLRINKFKIIKFSCMMLHKTNLMI
jgi:hypothetical protein